MKLKRIFELDKQENVPVPTPVPPPLPKLAERIEPKKELSDEEAPEVEAITRTYHKPSDLARDMEIVKKVQPGLHHHIVTMH
jgi:hypothetical protein